MTSNVKRCSRCKKELPVSEFRINGVFSNGAPMPHSYCNDCIRKYARWYFKNRTKRTLAELLDMLNEGKLNYTQLLMLAEMRTVQYEKDHPQWRKFKNANNQLVWERI